MIASEIDGGQSDIVIHPAPQDEADEMGDDKEDNQSEKEEKKEKKKKKKEKKKEKKEKKEKHKTADRAVNEGDENGTSSGVRKCYDA